MTEQKQIVDPESVDPRKRREGRQGRGRELMQTLVASSYALVSCELEAHDLAAKHR